MVIKKSQSSSKTKTANKKPAPKAVKKATPISTRKTVHSTEPYHQGFGIILLIICAIIAAALLIGATRSIVRIVQGNAGRFAEEYSEVEVDHVFKYKTAEEIIAILEHGTGVVFLGFPGCPWCQTYVPMLNDLAKAYGVKEIYYYNIKEDREKNTENYQKIVSILSDFLQYDETGDKRIYVPETAFVVEGEIIGNDWETSKNTLGIQNPKEYWTETRVENWKQNVGLLMARIKSAEGCTTSCNE